MTKADRASGKLVRVTGSNDHLKTVANRKVAGTVGDGFSWYRFEVVGDAVMLTGCESSGLVTRGKRKGKPRYDGKPVRVVVTEAEQAAECERYEAETGKCGDCMGTRQEFASWSREEGTRYRTCGACAGSGSSQLLVGHSR